MSKCSIPLMGNVVQNGCEPEYITILPCSFWPFEWEHTQEIKQLVVLTDSLSI